MMKLTTRDYTLEGEANEIMAVMQSLNNGHKQVKPSVNVAELRKGGVHKLCLECTTPLSGHQHKICGSAECKHKNKIRVTRAWRKRHSEKLEAYRSKYAQEKKAVNQTQGNGGIFGGLIGR